MCVFLAPWDPRFVHKAFSGAVLGALVVLLGILPQLHRPEASRNESFFDQSSDRFPPKGSVWGNPLKFTKNPGG